MGGYPTGPLPCGTVYDPTCKIRIPNMTHGGPLVVFSFWVLVFIACSLFQMYKAYHLKRHPVYPVVRGGAAADGRSMSSVKSKPEKKNKKNSSGSFTRDDTTKKADSELGAATQVVVNVVEEEEEGFKLKEQQHVQFTGYKSVVFGEICYGLCLLISLNLFCIYLLVLLDTYNKCQVRGIDNLCFFGNYFLFGTYRRNGTVFFSLWCISVVWFTTWVVFKRDVHNWFRLPCRLSQAQFVHVWAQDQLEILSINVTMVVHFVRKVKEKLIHPYQRGYTETIKVATTKSGKRHFLFQGQRYLIEEDSLHRAHFQVGDTFAEFHQVSQGLSTKVAESRLETLGPNEVPFRPEPFWKSIVEEMFTLFKVYQILIYSIWLWFAYLFVGALLFSIVLIAAAITIFNRRRSQFAIAKLTAYASDVDVRQDGVWTKVDFRLLVPGDLVRVRSNWSLPCDLLIIQGVCVCNESNLTGEAMPVQKYQAPEKGRYEPDTSRGARHTLFSGTEVLQAGAGGTSEVKAIVTATGMDTSKGKLLSTILFPEQMIFKYDEELPIVVLMLLCYAAVCFALSLVFQYRNGQESIWVTKWSYCIAILSQTVSPLLPVALEIGQIYASVRLKNRGIFCVNPKRIAIAGKIRVFCFDKTGTLTKNGLDFIGVQGVVKDIDAAADGQPTIVFGAVQSPQSGVDMIDKLVVQGLATCHAVTRFGDQFVGNEVEVKMFSAVGWELLEGGTESQPNPIVVNKNGERYTIVRRNEFEHSRATMSVVVQDSAGELHVFCKGSFEKIQEHSTEGSIPLGYLQTAKDHALGGCYVLGLSHKSLGTTVTLDEVKSMSRDNLERDLMFVSLLLFRNELKKDTRAAIEALREGQVRSLMVTGDNAQCGFYIAKECAMVAHHVQVLLADLNEAGSVVWQPMVTMAAESGQVLSTVDMLKVHGKGLEGGLTELAVTGKAFNILCKTGDMNQLLYYTRIFARFTPEDKVKVVTLHRDRGLVVGMCGDGGNDCGALRSAHAGLALSEAEASVVSPFTSKSKSVASVVDLLREGRAALHTSFACYKFLIIYGLSFSIFKLTANWYGAIPCQMDYLFIDGVAVLSLGYSMNLSNPQKKLSQIRPTSSLLGPQNVASVLGLWIVNVLFVLINLSYMHIQPDYVKWPAKYSSGNSWWVLGDNWESTVIFFTIYFQFVTSAMVFSFGSAFRRPVVFNYRLLGAWTAIITLMSFVLLLPHSSFTHLWHVASEDFNGPNSTSPVWIQYQAYGGAPSAAMPFSFRLHLWFLLLTNLVVIASWQKAVVEGPVAKFLRYRYPSSTPKFNL